MKKHIILVFALFLTAGTLASWAQRYDISTEERVYTEQEKEYIEHCKKAEAKYADLEPSGTFQEGDFGSGLYIRDYRENMSPEARAKWEKDMAEMKAMKATDIPAAYAWVLPDGKGPDDSVMIEKGEVSVVMPGRSVADYKALVARAAANGYAINAQKTDFEGMSVYEASSVSGEKCSIALMKGNLMINFEKKK